MSSYKNILFPFDSSIASDEPFSYVIDLAKSYGSRLIFLYTYRLDSLQDQKLISASDLKREMKLSAENQLESLKAKFDLDKMIKYEFHVEIGFLSSRVMVKITEYPIDLLVIEKRVLNDLNEATDRINCPIMIIPH